MAVVASREEGGEGARGPAARHTLGAFDLGAAVTTGLAFVADLAFGAGLAFGAEAFVADLAFGADLGWVAAFGLPALFLDCFAGGAAGSASAGMRRLPAHGGSGAWRRPSAYAETVLDLCCSSRDLALGSRARRSAAVCAGARACSGGTQAEPLTTTTAGVGTASAGAITAVAVAEVTADTIRALGAVGASAVRGTAGGSASGTAAMGGSSSSIDKYLLDAKPEASSALASSHIFSLNSFFTAVFAYRLSPHSGRRLLSHLRSAFLYQPTCP